MRHLIVALIALNLIRCADDKPDTFDRTRLSGKWVGVENQTDTLSFETLFDDKEFIVLKRDVLYRSGPYEYKLLPDEKISMHWMLAATFAFHEYHFKVAGDKLTIGNFYDSPSGAILTFRKID